MSNRVSLAELAAADLKLRPSEAVTIVASLCSQHIAGTLPGIPSPGVIRLTRDGDVIAEGPITTGPDPVARAAQLLNMLLSGSEALPEYRASGALRLVLSRALGTIDVPPYGSLAEFSAALSRFATEDVRSVARALFNAWERSSATRALKTAPADLTISDVRRARRATGLSLAYLATVAELPRTRLRDLEWGYLRDWPATEEGRAQVIRYARAAGLDESIVLSIAWPMIVEGSRMAAEAAPVVALVRATPPQTIIVPAAVPIPAAETNPHPRIWERRTFVAAAAVAALIAAFILGALAQSRSPRNEGTRVGLSDRPAPIALMPVSDTPANPVATEPREARDVPPEPAERTPQRSVVPASNSTPQGPAARPKQRRAPATTPRQGGRKSFFEREVFRIVFR